MTGKESNKETKPPAKCIIPSKLCTKLAPARPKTAENRRIVKDPQPFSGSSTHVSGQKKSLRGPTPQVKEGSIGKKAAKTFNRAQSDAFWGQWPTLLWVQDQILDPFGLSVFFLRRDEAPGWVRGRPFETQDESAAQDEGPGWVRGRAVRWQGVRGEPRMSRLARMKVLHGPDVFDGWRSEDDPSKPRMGLLARMNVQDECPCSMAG